MTHRLVLWLAGSHITMQVLQTTRHGIAERLGALLRGNATSSLHEAVLGQVEVSGATAAGDLGQLLNLAMAELKTLHATEPVAVEFDVQLGLSHSQVGLMPLEDISGRALAADKCEAYARAWVRQMLRLDPDNQVIRWEILGEAQGLLISCVDRHLFEVLKDFSARYGLRFIGCRPALMPAISAHASEFRRGITACDMTLVWTEGGAGAQRASAVQLMRFGDGRLRSTWRGWVPPSADGRGNDSALDGAIRRFRAMNRIHGDDVLSRVCWPASGQTDVSP